VSKRGCKYDQAWLLCCGFATQYELVASAGDESVLAGGESALTEPLTVTLFGAREC